MKRSRSMGLMVLGTVTLLAGCMGNTPRADIIQQQYASRADCEKDWNESSNCQRSSGGGYVGPRYYWNHAAGVPMALMPNGSERAMPKSSLARGVPSAAIGTNVVAKSAAVGKGSSTVTRGGFGGRASSAGG